MAVSSCISCVASCKQTDSHISELSKLAYQPNVSCIFVQCLHNDHAGGCRHVHEQLTDSVQQAVELYQGSECLLLVIQALQDEASRVVEAAQQHAVEKSKTGQEQLALLKRTSQIGRRSIW